MIGHLARVASFIALCAVLLIGTQGSGATEGGSPSGEVPESFTRIDLNLEILEPTALTYGPDGRLYVANQQQIVAITLDSTTHDVVAVEQIAAGLAGVLGLAFDQTASPKAPLTLYASHQDPLGVPGYWGRVSSFTAPDWTQQVVISDLPSSAPRLNHLTNGLTFSDDGLLYFAQGSNTDTGFVGEPAPEYFAESPLSAAILVADVNEPGFEGSLTYNPPGEPLDHNVDLVSGDVAVFSPGHRNPYDLVFHSNGFLYATDNGATGQDGPSSCDGASIGTSVHDELNLVEEGNYHGFPNLNRGRTEPRECVYRDPEDGDGPNTTGPIAVLSRHCSCDGIIEYSGPALDGELNGDLIIASFGRGLLYRVQLSEDGRGVTNVTTLVEDLDAPLDVAQGPSGVIYVVDFDDDLIAAFVPIAPTPTPTEPATATSPATDTPEPTSTPSGPLGDANCDGVTNSIDAAIVLQSIAGLIGEVGCQDLADVNSDGVINAIDATIILQINAGLL